MVEEFTMKLLNGAFQIIGSFVQSQMSQPTEDKQQQNLEEYYTKTLRIAQQLEKEQQKKIPVEIKKDMPKSYQEHQREYPANTPVYIRDLIPPEPHILPEKDMTPEKIEKGVACVACTSEHFSTASGALNEALRFARKEGIDTWEVQRRLGMAKDELNMAERIDLAAENIIRMQGREKEIAEAALVKSRDLRHEITAIKNSEDLERVAAKAAEIRTEVMKNIFSMATTDGTIDKLCKGLSDEDKQRCMTTLNKVLERKKEEELR